MIGAIIFTLIILLILFYYYLEWKARRDLKTLRDLYIPEVDMSRKENNKIKVTEIIPLPETMHKIDYKPSTEEIKPISIPTTIPVPTEPKPKRFRRTPAQMAAARALENPTPKEEPKDDPITPGSL